METIYVETKCIFCGTTSVFELSKDGYDRWQAGEHIQSVFPELTADEREELISGTCAPCWDKQFGGE
jgi:hypothetical protein